jgi:hypothetical protein
VQQNSMNLDGLTFGVTSTAAIGVVSSDTRLRVVQRGTRVLGRYDGGSIQRGYLVGRVQGEALIYRYAQRELGGRVHGGHSHCDLEVLQDGRVRIHEHFTWATRDGAGTNVFEQVNSGDGRQLRDSTALPPNCNG